MDQLELFELPNPCIGVCESNQRGYCKGCLRSREERFNWHLKPAAERARILKLLAQRRARLQQKANAGSQPEPQPGSLDLF
ncbi:Fe-S protein-like protein [Alishewanella agri BL06]|uniref:Fe-S protein-like protein n=1 Tax=Alishewanella agri BL06 TaxID=1195246 RepID=I8U5I2_9ALTE|nr:MULTISPECIES: DUF1289 domain-containing protein [Alishewanella]EIW88586.1 Fe-S protein-like protein [Alishewanella agri BL06]MCT8127498.1 DUF1289 domain-containing protein [Alishewanella sp. BS5-314]OCW96158.1 oxidoreductase [Alishewanella sp. HH-ZS]